MILEERPYVAVVPVLSRLREMHVSLSAEWFKADDESSMQRIVCGMADYVSALVESFAPGHATDSCFESLVAGHKERIFSLMADRSDLNSDKLMKAEVFMLSADLVAFCLRCRGINARVADTAGMVHLDCERVPDVPSARESVKRLVAANRDADMFVAPMSLCCDVEGCADFMGDRRNDYYAVALAAAFGADEAVLATRMDNIRTLGGQGRDGHSLTYLEAEQLVNSGAYLIYMDGISLAERYGIALRLYGADDLKRERMYVSAQDTGHGVKAVFVRDDVSFVRFTSKNIVPPYLFLGKLLDVLAKYKIRVDSMASSNVSVSMVLAASGDALRMVGRDVRRYADMAADEGMSLVNLIGSLGWEQTKVEQRIMSAMREVAVSFISYGGSDHCFTVAVHSADKARLLDTLGGVLGDVFGRRQISLGVPDLSVSHRASTIAMHA